AETGRLELKLLPRRVLSDPGNPDALPPSIPFDFKPGVDTLEALEKRMIVHALEQTGNVKSEAARLLGISRFQLMRRMDRHGLSKKGK
ncbi:MAG: hypothetical protein JRJ19_14990, partial [Deltaproteobacteria bacterium]|nr:hypothetical protein [Deltaproteobacteria bacterium]